MRYRIVTAIIFSFLPGTSLLADAGQFYLAPGLQWMNFDHETGLEDDGGFFIGLGYDFTDRFSVELSTFDLAPNRVDNGRENDVDHY
jgi:hypothetical protein